MSAPLIVRFAVAAGFSPKGKTVGSRGWSRAPKSKNRAAGFSPEGKAVGSRGWSRAPKSKNRAASFSPEGKAVGSRGWSRARRNPRIKVNLKCPGPDGAAQRRSKQIPFVVIYSSLRKQFTVFLHKGRSAMMFFLPANVFNQSADFWL